MVSNAVWTMLSATRAERTTTQIRSDTLGAESVSNLCTEIVVRRCFNCKEAGGVTSGCRLDADLNFNAAASVTPSQCLSWLSFPRARASLVVLRATPSSDWMLESEWQVGGSCGIEL